MNDLWERVHRPMPGRSLIEPIVQRDIKPPKSQRKKRMPRERDIVAEVKETLRFERDLGTDSERADLYGEAIGEQADTKTYPSEASDPGEVK